MLERVTPWVGGVFSLFFFFQLVSVFQVVFMNELLVNSGMIHMWGCVSVITPSVGGVWVRKLLFGVVVLAEGLGKLDGLLITVHASRNYFTLILYAQPLVIIPICWHLVFTRITSWQLFCWRYAAQTYWFALSVVRMHTSITLIRAEWSACILV